MNNRRVLEVFILPGPGPGYLLCNQYHINRQRGIKRLCCCTQRVPHKLRFPPCSSCQPICRTSFLRARRAICEVVRVRATDDSNSEEFFSRDDFISVGQRSIGNQEGDAEIRRLCESTNHSLRRRIMSAFHNI